MELHEFIRSRRSIRRFKAGEIPPAVVERILATASYAPSAHNRQPWRFAVVSTDTAKARLADAMAAEYRRDLEADGMDAGEIESLLHRSEARIKASPLVIVLCMEASEMPEYPDARRTDAERTMAVQSTASAGTLILLAAHAEGLGAVWNCSPLFATKAVASSLDLPGTWEPQAMLLIGRPAEVSRPRKRRSPPELTIFA